MKASGKGATGKGCGSYSVSHPNITHMTVGSRSRLEPAERGSGKGATDIDVTRTPGLSTALPRGKGKSRAY